MLIEDMAERDWKQKQLEADSAVPSSLCPMGTVLNHLLLALRRPLSAQQLAAGPRHTQRVGRREGEGKKQ